MPIKISIVDDVKSFLSGAGKAEDALDDVAGALDDLAREAQQSGRATGDDLAQGVDRGTEQAEDSVQKLEKSFRDMARDAGKHSKDAGDDVGRNVKAGYRDAEQAAERFGDTAKRETGRAAETTEEFRDEARSNFSEVTSSFQGDMTSAVDLVQGTLGGLAGSIPGGVGLAMGGLAVVAGTFAALWQEAAEATKARLGDMYDDMVESGNDFLSESLIQQEVRKIMLNEDERVTDYAAALDIAGKSGLDLAVVLRGLAGDQDANRVTQEALNAALTQAEADFDAARAAGEDVNAVYENTQGISGYIELLARQGDTFGTASEKADQAREATTEWSDTLEQLPREIRTELGLNRDITSEQEARATYDGLGRRIETEARIRITEVDDALWRNWRPGVKNGSVTITSPSAPSGAYGKAYG